MTTFVNGDPVEPEPMTPPSPTGPLSNYLIIYAYQNGQAEFHCSNLDPTINFKMLAVAADALSSACKKMQQDLETFDESRIRRVS